MLYVMVWRMGWIVEKIQGFVVKHSLSNHTPTNKLKKGRIGS